MSHHPVATLSFLIIRNNTRNGTKQITKDNERKTTLTDNERKMSMKKNAKFGKEVF